ncbi:MAG: hypothetical protein LBB61_08470 [Treponema sp.]|jgi:hypothetical protein|nr:hypothetical protein [Treponema sp.]
MNHSESKIRHFCAGFVLTAVLALTGGCGDAALAVPDGSGWGGKPSPHP